jgi:DnaJ family protein C protein 3
VQTPEQFLETLNEVVRVHPDAMDLLMERGELLIEMGDYDAANFDFTTVQRRAPNQRAQEGLNRATELKKKATYVDHYATLGVQKDAGTQEITAAYKTLAKQWHPDRFSDKEKKKEAEQMMKKINVAYDILGNDEKRRRYDQGVDPDHPGQHGMNMNGSPFDFFFQGGGMPFQFQQGGFEFHFEGGQGFHFQF